ncbi:aspartate--tRNA ligase [Ruthenibacterium lactatiformans]|uniref:aspartate--tRNA ligase n=1 Tax=Ruthenibacterium lactatiformans TaxID=1550024 RepID=UPI003AB248FC
MYRTHTCGALRAANVGQTVTLAGWVQKVRNLGAMTFIDLRDRYGLTQIVVEEHSSEETRRTAAELGREFVLQVTGRVIERESKNPKLPTGEIEIAADALVILNRSDVPPFTIEEESDGGDDLRMKYRYLDLRRPPLQRALILRHRMAHAVRTFLDGEGFLEIETPYLIKSTPEGARDFVVPSRMNPNQFYALPQSPQTLKQLLMVAGYDKYFQIVRCFRDEDLRADRQPEFTQIDMEMSFVTEDDVMAMNEGLVKRVFREVLGVDVETPFRRMPYSEAMARYGSDKPDTRFGLELQDVTDVLQESGFAVFKSAVEAGGSVRLINAKGLAGALTRKEIDKLVDVAKTYGAKGLAYTRLTADGVTSSFEKFLSEEEKAALHKAAGAETGDVLLVVADAKNSTVFAALGALRLAVANKCGLIDPDKFNFLWVTDFPFFEYSEEEGRWMAMHHPFTMPRAEDLDKVESDPGSVRALAYDMVLNGCELGGGSIRINDPAVQDRMLKALGFSEERARESFGFLMDAYQYGAPPHGGMAFGFDRMVMLMLKRDSIRDVIAFPKVQNAGEPMSGCPETVEEKQLRELSIAYAPIETEE